MRRKRRNHSPGFKAKIAFAALKGDKTLAQLAGEYDLRKVFNELPEAISAEDIEALLPRHVDLDNAEKINNAAA